MLARALGDHDAAATHLQVALAQARRLRAPVYEREIVELTWVNAVNNYLNMQAKPLGLAPEGACEIPQRPARG